VSDVFKKWAQGDEFAPSAAQLNAWTDAARMVQQGLNQTSPVLGTPEQYFTRLRMRNNTGEVIPQLGIIGYSTPMITPATSQEQFIYDMTVNAIKPTTPLDRFAITLSQVEIGAVFDAAIGGVIPCKVTGSGTKVQAISNDMTKLQAGATGADLVWSESGSSTRFGLVKLFGAGSSCTKRYQLFYLGSVSSGSFLLPVASQTKTGGVRSGSYTTENVTIPYNATNTQVKNAIEGHSLIDVDEVTVTGSASLLTSNATITMPEGTYLGTGGTGEITNTSLVRIGLQIPKVYLFECCQ
jgi:hypothetical protein